MIPTFLTKREYNKTSKTHQDTIRVLSNECNFKVEENTFSQRHQPTNSFSLLEEHIPNTQAKSNSYLLQPTDPTVLSRNRFEPISDYNTSLPSQSDTRTVSKHIYHNEGNLI